MEMDFVLKNFTSVFQSSRTHLLGITLTQKRTTDYSCEELIEVLVLNNVFGSSKG